MSSAKLPSLKTTSQEAIAGRVRCETPGAPDVIYDCGVKYSTDPEEQLHELAALYIEGINVVRRCTIAVPRPAGSSEPCTWSSQESGISLARLVMDSAWEDDKDGATVFYKVRESHDEERWVDGRMVIPPAAEGSSCPLVITRKTKTSSKAEFEIKVRHPFSPMQAFGFFIALADKRYITPNS